MSHTLLVEFKGHKEGIYLQIHEEAPFEAVLAQLRERLEKGRAFFAGARVIGIVGRDLETEEVEAIRGIIQGEYQLDMVEKPVKKTPKLIFDLEGVPSHDGPAETEARCLGDTVFHRGNLRSGRRIESHGHLVVLGDVNPGAELVADGNIVVMGMLRGVAHAGRSGDEGAFVSANHLEPTQLRIAGKITRSPDEGYEHSGYPEVATIRDGMIVFEPYV